MSSKSSSRVIASRVVKFFLRFIANNICPAQKHTCDKNLTNLGNSIAFFVALVCLLRDLNALHELPRIWQTLAWAQ